LTTLSKYVSFPLVTGERLYNLYQFKELLNSRTCSMIRFDLSLAGGFTQCRKIAALAEAAFVGAFPHLMSSPVNKAAYIQFDAAIPNYQLQESDPDADRLNEISRSHCSARGVLPRARPAGHRGRDSRSEVEQVPLPSAPDRGILPRGRFGGALTGPASEP
jgi:L-alanine-DL-glutamate epimerase-like enolase superfamily enzyme